MAAAARNRNGDGTHRSVELIEDGGNLTISTSHAYHQVS